MRTVYLGGLCVLAVLFAGELRAQLENTVSVMLGDEQALINAIQQANSQPDQPLLIFIDPSDSGESAFVFTQPFEQGGANALPVITGQVVILGGFGPPARFLFASSAQRFRFAEIAGDGLLSMYAVQVTDFDAIGDGGAFLIKGNGLLGLLDVKLDGNSASGNGGAIAVRDMGQLSLGACQIAGNMASQLGGGVSVNDQGAVEIRDCNFSQNSALIFGCDVNINSSGKLLGLDGQFLDETARISNSVFTGSCMNTAIENPEGTVLLEGNTFTGRARVIDSTDLVKLFANLFDLNGADGGNNAPQKADKAVCNDFGVGVFESLGYNLSSESSCHLDQSTDRADTDPRTLAPDAQGVVALQVDSPAIEGGLATRRSDGSLPCGFRDSRGLGRPQDADGDGVFACDIGAWEQQGGADLTAAQSGFFYDPARPGEGVVLEILPDGRALVALFAHQADGSGALWLTGAGLVNGNSVVIEQMQLTRGGVFGEAYDAAAIRNEYAGGLSLIFPDCEAGANAPGRLVFQPQGAGAEIGLQPLLLPYTRLSRLLNCQQGQIDPASGRSGAYYNPARVGEGVFLHVIDDNEAIVIVFTYTPDGDWMWIISGDAVNIDGASIHANMRYPVGGAGFGDGFDPGVVNLQPWGDVTITVQPGCESLILGFNSTAPDYGSGSRTMQRLTRPAGLLCDL